MTFLGICFLDNFPIDKFGWKLPIRKAISECFATKGRLAKYSDFFAYQSTNVMASGFGDLSKTIGTLKKNKFRNTTLECGQYIL